MLKPNLPALQSRSRQYLQLAAAIAAVGAVAVGAVAIGAVAIGRLAVGSLHLRRGRIDKLVVGELEVGRLTINEARGWSAQFLRSRQRETLKARHALRIEAKLASLPISGIHTQP